MRRGAPLRTNRLVVAVVIGLVSLLGDIPQAVTAPIVSSVSLPTAFALSQVFVAAGQLVLTGSQCSRSASVTNCYTARALATRDPLTP